MKIKRNKLVNVDGDIYRVITVIPQQQLVTMQLVENKEEEKAVPVEAPKAVEVTSDDTPSFVNEDVLVEEPKKNEDS